MRPSSTLKTRPSAERPILSPRLNPVGLLSLVLLAVILFAGPCVLGAVRPWIELPILGGVSLLWLMQAGRLVAPAQLGSLRQIDAIDLSVLLFTAYAIVRWLTSPIEYFSRLEVLSVIGYAAVFLCCRYGLGRRKNGVMLVVLLVALGVGEVIFGYLLHLHSNAADPQSLWYPFGPAEQMQLYWAPRWLGTYGCPNHYACLLVMATGAALALACFSRFPWPARIVLFYVAAFLVVGIVYSQSRGSWFSLVGVVAALMYFGLRHGRLRWWLLLAGGAVLCAILGAVFRFSPVVDTRIDQMTSTLHSGALDKYLRIELTEDALRIAHDHPLFGTGPATYAYVDPRYQVSSLNVRAGYTHDDYLNCLDDYGLVGFAIAMFFVGAVTLALFSKIQADSRWTERVLVAAALLAWSALLVHSFVDFNLHIPANAMLLFALTGMALSRKPDEDAPFHWSTISLVRFGPALGWTLAVAALLYGVEIVRTALTDFPYESASSDSDIVPTAQSIRGVQQSLSFDSANPEALVLLGDLHRVRAARADTDQERAAEGSEAVEAYRQALRANPFDDSVHARMGLTYDLMERYPEAYLCYEDAVNAQPYNGRFWMLLGQHFLKRGLIARAEQAYATAVKCPYGKEGAAKAEKRMYDLLHRPPILAPRTETAVSPALSPAPPPIAPAVAAPRAEVPAAVPAPGETTLPAPSATLPPEPEPAPVNPQPAPPSEAQEPPTTP